MRLDSIEPRALTIPFRTAFRHASADRARMQSLWVEACAQGETGHGEGCPREYVTGESLAGALQFCAMHREDWCASIGELDALRRWARAHAGDIDRNPAAWAAVELALLELMAKLQGVSVERVLGVTDIEGCFAYTAVLGDAEPAVFEAQLAHYLKAGFRDFKIKLSGVASRDRAKVDALRNAGIAERAVRADANNLWKNAHDAIAALEALAFSFRALEEPLGAGDYAGMSSIAAVLGTRIILDESVLRAGQLDALDAAPERWIVNLRVSKMGGLMRSLQMASELRRRGTGLIVGAHVGETSVLTRAALTVANAARDILVAQEGAFGTHLLSRDVSEPPLMFGAGGVLDASAYRPQAAGWGLSIDTAALDFDTA
jgi:L-alanine-DL-glutamate epimerase-like enolase superfamily enzyme